ncbi:Sulfite exporter TauE/SafE family protein 3 [Sesamum angolense]|uniref:Sulfite exporter TauE/SafE family protein 3 n=1 Tax=Sesamum angolense TaxID=2727404 RepID=A0AAE1W8T9_9LAMI|nr:Sulfite exporter TauE/SafE family protein 3 [Sesamum angolense]
MARNLEKWRAFGPLFTVLWSFLLASIFVSAERSLKQESLSRNATRDSDSDSDLLSTFVNFIWQANKSGYHHVWPDLKFNWQIVVGSIIGFFGAAFGSVGGVGGGGIFVPMLSLIIGFDPKSATAISKCMIMGAAVSTVYYNLKLRHPTIDMPIIDYDLAVLIQPMLMLGISIGVAFNVLFADWMVTVLLIILFIVTSTKAFLKGVETWKKETIMKKEAAKRLETNGDGKEDAEYKLLPGGPSNNTEKEAKDLEEPEVRHVLKLALISNNSNHIWCIILSQVSIIENVCWKEFGLLVFVWIAFLAVQIIKEYTTTCSTSYWVVNLLQVPVSFGVSGYEAVSLYKGWRKIGSKGDEGTNFKVHQLLTYGLFGVLAGMVGGLLGLGGGFIMGPLFLELGVPPQVSSATATFAMMFSSSMSVVEYYLLKRFPVPYGGVGISNMVGKIQRHEYMGFENLCKYEV